MKSSFILIILAFFGMQLLHGQEAEIRGKIINESTGAGIPGVHLYLRPVNIQTVSQADGNFQIKKLKPGHNTLEIGAIGFKSKKLEISLLPNEHKILSIRLEEDIYQLPGLEVSGISLTSGMTGSYELPGNGFYLSPQKMKAFADFDVNGLLKEIPGVYFQEEDGFGLRPNIGLRGTGSERSQKITLMEDGILAAPAPYSAPSAYYFPTVGRMYSMEVLKGSSQIRFGPYTTGGAVNFISTPIPSEMKAHVNVEGGNFGLHRAHAYAGNSHKYGAYLVETYQYGSNGFKELPNNDPTGFEKSDYLAKVRINTAPEKKIYQSLTVKAGWMNERSNETYLGISESDFEKNPYQRYAASSLDLMKSSHRQLSALYKILLSKNAELALQVYDNEFKRNWYKTDKVLENGEPVSIAEVLNNSYKHSTAFEILRGNEDGELYLKANNRSYLSRGIQLHGGFAFNGTYIHHKILSGLRLHYDEMDRFQHVDRYEMKEGQLYLKEKGEPGTESNRLQYALAWSGFVQYSLKYKGLTIMPGVRVEDIKATTDDYGKNDPDRSGEYLKSKSNQSLIAIPGVGADYKWTEKAHLFAGIHRGFSPAGSDPEARPELSVNYEMGIYGRRRSSDYRATVWLHDFSNLLGSDLAAGGGSGTTRLFNGGSALAYGLETELTHTFSIKNTGTVNFPVSIIYSYTEAHFRNDFESEFEAWGSVHAGDEIPYIPNHIFTFSGGVHLPRFEADLRLNYMSAMRTIAGSGPIDPSNATDARFLIDAAIRYYFNNNINLSISASNLNNAVYIAARRPAGIRPGAPRMIRVGLTVDL